MGKHADATFLVVKEGRNTAQELEVSFKRFQQVGIKPNGFIINDMKEGSSYSPYYGYAYSREEDTGKAKPSWIPSSKAAWDWFEKRQRGLLPALESRQDDGDGQA